MPNSSFLASGTLAGLLISVAGTASVLAAPPFPPAVGLSSLDGITGFKLNGIDVNDSSGLSVSFAGDLNGDGIGDLIIGAAKGDPGGRTDAGECYIVFGRDTAVEGPFATSIDLATLDGAIGFVVNGISPADRFGIVSSAGDVNGDGIDDVIIGAPGGDRNGESSGETYILFGKHTAVSGPFAASIDASSLGGTTGFVLNGIHIQDISGGTVSSAGDVNGDGVGDVIIGAPGADPGGKHTAGESYVVFGRNTAVSGPFAASISLTSLDGVTGFKLNGVDAYDGSGISVSAAGDVNGDGIGDVIVGARFADPGGRFGAGEAYIVFGKNTAIAGQFPASIELSSLDGATGFVCNGVDAEEFCGSAVSSAGDVNSDGVDDVVIGAPDAASNGPNGTGQCYVVFGKNTAIAGQFASSIELSTLDGVNGFVCRGIDFGDQAGGSVSAAGDVNDDGIDDMVIGARSADAYGTDGQASHGESYVLFGKNTALSGPFAASINLSSLDGITGFVCKGIGRHDFSGWVSAGDVNGDGISDLIIGANAADPGGISNAGETYVVFGRAPDPCPGDINGDGDTNAADFVILAGNFGSAVPPNTGGDLNGDGLVNAADFVILAGDFGCEG